MGTKIDESRILRTEDVSLAAFLMAKGARLWATDCTSLGRVEFCLTSLPSGDDLTAFVKGCAIVNVRDYSSAIRIIKGAMRRAKDNGVAL
jgi:hypothetical protein